MGLEEAPFDRPSTATLVPLRERRLKTAPLPVDFVPSQQATRLHGEARTGSSLRRAESARD